MDKLTKRLLLMTALFSIVLVPRALAADAGVEFGVEDDLTVKGTGGNETDADLKVYGYSAFGNGAGAQKVITGRGNVYLQNNLEIGKDIRDRMEELRDESGSRSLTDVVSRALAVYEYLWRQKKTGGKILIQDSDGTRELVLL